jgi:hypothetical protein
MPPVKEDEKSLKEKLRAKALDMYENELHVPPALDLGLKSGSRSQLRVVCRTVVLESSQITKRKYSHSNLSSGEWSNKGDDKNTDDAITRLRSLQKERLIISRMGFADRAKQLDVEIEEMRVKAADAKAAREQTLLQENLEILERKMNRKKDRMEVIMNSETVKLEQALNKEFRKMRNRCVIPLSFSRGFESMIVTSPSSNLWAPVYLSSVSTSVVFPWSTCAMIEKLRINWGFIE